jgi:VWFA-related protein
MIRELMEGSMLSVRLLIVLCLCVALTVKAQDTALIRRTPESEAARVQHDRHITLDIEVADGAHKPLTGLAQSDFTLLDNGARKPLTSFQEIDAHTTHSPTEAVLVFDAMNATFEDAGIMRQGIDAFLRQNGGRLPLPVSILFLTDTGSKLGVSSSDGVELAKDFSRNQTPIRVLDSAQGIGGAMDRERRSVRALQMISEYEATRPGRKLVLWIGPGWPLLAGPRTSELSAENARRYYDTVVGLTTQLRRAQITLYSVAPLNLSHGTGQTAFLYQSFLKGVTAPGQADSPNLGVQVLAIHSGGLVLEKSGDLPAQINRCLADSASFYEVTFDADPGDEAGVYHSIDVTVDRPGAVARTNTAYYAGKPQAIITPPRKDPAPGSLAQGPALRTQARLVVLDVTVLDNKGAPIAGLRPDDFQLLDDGHPQAVTHLEEHSGAPAGASLTPQPTAPAGSFVAGNQPPRGSTWNVIAVDLIDSPKEERAHI